MEEVRGGGKLVEVDDAVGATEEQFTSAVLFAEVDDNACERDNGQHFIRRLFKSNLVTAKPLGQEAVVEIGFAKKVDVDEEEEEDDAVKFWRVISTQMDSVS